MEDFVEIIFYVVILALSGIGSLLKNKKKSQASVSEPREVLQEDSREERPVVDQPAEVEENELIRMLREAAAAAEAQQREKEALEQQQKARQEEQARRKAEEENVRKVELIREQRAAERVKQQAETKKIEYEVAESENSSIFGLNLSDVDEARRAFVASEIFNKKYC